MRVTVVGAGAIGSTFAFLLSRAGHDVAVVARGARLEQLRADGAVVHDDGTRAPVRALPSLDEGSSELVLVAVRGADVEAVLPALARCDAPTVMFMFNAARGTARLRDAVGAGRFAWGFPAVVARLVDGRLEMRGVPRVLAFAQITTVWGAEADRWARVFDTAGVPTAVHDDLEGWLRSHAAFMAPVMLVPPRAPWAEARRLVRVMQAQLARLGERVTPRGLRLVRALPGVLVAAALWALSRTAPWRSFDAHAAEGRWLLDELARAD